MVAGGVRGCSGAEGLDASASGRRGEAKKKRKEKKARTCVGSARLAEQAAQSFLAEALAAGVLEHHKLLGRPRFCLAELVHVYSGRGCHQVVALLGADLRLLAGQVEGQGELACGNSKIGQLVRVADK